MNLNISEDIKIALKYYIENDLNPGSYLMAIINNDLRGAINNAHTLELPHILDTIFYVDLKMRKK
jgi:hypothetical protein